MIFARLEDLLKEYKEKVSARLQAADTCTRTISTGHNDFYNEVRRLIAKELQARPAHSISRDLRNLVELLELGVF